MKAVMRVFAAAVIAVAMVACAEQTAGYGGAAVKPAAGYDKTGFVTEVTDGRLWVFKAGSREIDEFKNTGELGKMVTRVGSGPNGMTIRAADGLIIDEYLGAK